MPSPSATFRIERSSRWFGQVQIGPRKWGGGRAINAAGTVVGEVVETSEFQAASWDATGHLTNIGTILGARRSMSWAVNDVGVVVGTADGHGFIYLDGHATDLNRMVPAQFTIEWGISINNRGQIGANGRCGGVARSLLLTPP